MPFPTSNRVVYRKNPLIEVVCQVRFPPILRLESELPIRFQEAVNDTFPVYDEKIEKRFAFGFASNQSPDAVKELAQSTATKNHQFKTDDGDLKLSLTRSFLSISAYKYTDWPHLLGCFKPALDALQNVYAPRFFNRVGLRYINVFDLRNLDLDGTAWKELLHPALLGLLATDLAPHVKNFESTYEVALEDQDSTVRISSSFVENSTTHEKCFKLDSDFYYPEKLDPSEVTNKLHYLHAASTNEIQWAIQQKLHEAMEPQGE